MAIEKPCLKCAFILAMKYNYTMYYLIYFAYPLIQILVLHTPPTITQTNKTLIFLIVVLLQYDSMLCHLPFCRMSFVFHSFSPLPFSFTCKHLHHLPMFLIYTENSHLSVILLHKTQSCLRNLNTVSMQTYKSSIL